MKKIILFVISALALFNLSSCFEDEGNYDYMDLPRFVVDTTGVNMSVTVTQFEQLSVPSRLVYDGNKSDLDFYWIAYERDTYGQNLSDTLATSENFDQKITLSPGSYLLEFLAVVKETGRRSSMQYYLTVESAVGTGLLIFYKKGNECDVDIVKTKTLIGSFTENKTVRNIYSRIDENVKLKGDPWKIVCMSDYIDLYTDIDGSRVTLDDMGFVSDFNGMFWDAPAVCKPQGFYNTNALNNLLVNDGELFFLNGNWAEGGALYPGGLVIPGENYYVAPYTIFTYGGTPYCYDTLSNGFLVAGSWSSVLQRVTDPKLQNLNMDMQYMGLGYVNITKAYYAYGVMKGKSTSDWHLFAMNSTSNPSTCKMVADFNITSSPEITSSRYYDLSTVSPLLYYTSATSVYTLPFDLDSATPAIPSAPGWTCPSGEEITAFMLFKDAGIGLSESVANKLLLVGTWNGSEGKVYILRTDMASGMIDSTPVETLGGFGKIGSMAFKKS